MAKTAAKALAEPRGETSPLFKPLDFFFVLLYSFAYDKGVIQKAHRMPEGDWWLYVWRFFCLAMYIMSQGVF